MWLIMGAGWEAFDKKGVAHSLIESEGIGYDTQVVAVA